MSGQGYHIAIDREQMDDLLGCAGEFEMLDWASATLEGIWQREDTAHVEGGSKDWNVLLCCLTNGSYDPLGGTYPLNRCFFGGRLLVREGSIVNFVVPEEVRDVAQALNAIDKKHFKERYMRLPSGEFHRDTLAKTEEYLNELYAQMIRLREFYQRAAEEARAVVFYTDDPLDYFFKGST